MENTENKETTEKNNTNKENTENMDKEIYSGCGCSNPNAFAQTMKDGFNKVFGSMKCGCIALMAAIAFAVGCATLPTVDKMYEASYLIGATTATVANITKIDDNTRNEIVKIVNIVENCIPETNQTFEAAWTPIAEAHTKKLVEDGKIDEGQRTLILTGFKLVTKGIDYLFTVRYPEARKYQDLTEAAVHGFCSGFLTVFKPVNSMVLSSGGEITIDRDAFEYLIKN